MILLIDLTVHGVHNDVQPVLAHGDPNSVPLDDHSLDICLGAHAGRHLLLDSPASCPAGLYGSVQQLC